MFYQKLQPLRHRLKPLTFAFAAAASGSAKAGDVAMQRLTIAVEPIDEITINGPYPTLTVDAAEAGDAPAVVWADGGGYAMTPNGRHRRITAALAAEMPAGVTLSMRMDAPSTGQSAGWRALSTAPTEMVTGIEPVAEVGIGIRYQLVATVDAGIISARTETVQVTLTDGH